MNRINQFLKQKYPNENINANEKLLFHGTGGTNPRTIVSHHDSFMRDYSSIGFYGKGLYFAELARYSNDGYSYNIPGSNLYQLLVCSVICGKSKEYGTQVDDGTKSLSQKDINNNGYQSVHAGPHQPTMQGKGYDDSCMYVIYKDTQVVPRYLITYKEI